MYTLTDTLSLYDAHPFCAQKQSTFQTVHQKCVLCTETEHFPDGTSEICTVHRNRTLFRRYIRNMYCAQKQKSFPDVTSEMCTVHRNRALSRRYIRNVYSAQKQNTFQTVHQKCALYTEREHFRYGTSEMCTVPEIEHFPSGTHKAIFTNHKTTFTNGIQLFIFIEIYHDMQVT
jgi:hypothetical protein